MTTVLTMTAQAAVAVAEAARATGLPIPADVLPVLEEAAAPWPAAWLLAPLPDEPQRVVELFAGPGGWTEGMTAVLGVTVDAVGVDISPDACATARAAGHRRICADITTLDPEHPALLHTRGIIVSPPCPAFSPAGKLTGLQQASIEILCECISAVGEAAGFIRLDDVECEVLYPDSDCELCAELGYHEGYAPRSGASWDDVRSILADLSDPRIGLMAEVAIWPLAMQAAGAPIAWVAMEQSSNLPQQVLEDFSIEFECADWCSTTWSVLEAADYGVPSRRKRVFMVATMNRYVRLAEPVKPMPVTSLAEALGWATGERINTRGNRPVDTVTGRAKGGNCFSADRPSWCLTGKARTWYRESDGLRLTEAEAGMLVAFRRSYPWQGSRSSAFQQAADVVSPVMSAVVMSAVQDTVWEPLVREYLAALYGRVEAGEDFELTV